MMELLAPAGGMEQLRAAVRFGADAVYGGLPMWGLRANAQNFSWDDLASALSFVHGSGKKFYLTMNLLPFDGELPQMADAAARAWDMGVDGAIVADMGAFLTLRERVPGLPLHVSTQANVMNTKYAKLFQDLGAKRIVLARELSLDKIRSLHERLPDLPLEAFCHGAMCMAFSGRCMFSDHMTGRGGNRGECAQPCRWHYSVVEDKRPDEAWEVEVGTRGTALFSAYDLNMLSCLPEMRDAGISSLKIEGRMKTAYYVASVVSVYRRALDLMEQSVPAYRDAFPQLQKDLDKASHRVSNTGFYFGAPEPASGAESVTQSMEYIADVDEGDGEYAYLTVKNRFFVGDTVEFLTPKGSFPLPVGDIITPSGEHLPKVTVAGQHVKIPCPVKTGKGDFVRGINRNHL